MVVWYSASLVEWMGIGLTNALIEALAASYLRALMLPQVLVIQYKATSMEVEPLALVISVGKLVIGRRTARTHNLAILTEGLEWGVVTNVEVKTISVETAQVLEEVEETASLGLVQVQFQGVVLHVVRQVIGLQIAQMLVAKALAWAEVQALGSVTSVVLKVIGHQTAQILQTPDCPALGGNFEVHLINVKRQGLETATNVVAQVIGPTTAQGAIPGTMGDDTNTF